MEVSIQMELFRVKCPACPSKDTYHRLKTKNYRCRQCGTTFKVVRTQEELLRGRKEALPYVLGNS